MRTLEQVINSLPADERAEVLARGHEIIAQMAVAAKIMKQRRAALRELAKR